LGPRGRHTRLRGRGGGGGTDSDEGTDTKNVLQIIVVNKLKMESE
jgi:hypothetical protein